MTATSKEYAKFKRLFVGPVLTRKQRIALMPAMPAEKPNRANYKAMLFESLSPIDQRKALWSAYVVERQKKRAKSMPSWANRKAIQEIYLKARQLTIETGIRHEVDHIIPSNHKLVCGLHVENNLQILTEAENGKKSNKFNV